MKKEDIAGIFNSIYGRYDLANTLLSAGVEKSWRRHFLKRFSSCDRIILDACCGTGISSYQISRKLKDSNIYGVDFSEMMLAVAKKNYSNISNLKFLKSDASILNFSDNYFDCISIVFGIRNITDRKAALTEFYRVARPGSKLLIMEFGNIEKSFFASVYNFYLGRILPNLGGALTGNKDAYRYLVHSIREFPKPEVFIKLIESAGWREVEASYLTAGICNIYSAFKPEQSN